MSVIELDNLDSKLREQLLGAMTEPIVITENQRPIMVVRNLLDDDAVR